MRTSKSTRRHAQELITNLHLIQAAHCHLKNLSISNTSFANYLSFRFFNSHSNYDQEKYQLRHQCKTLDKIVHVFFPFSKINSYQTLHIGKLRLSTRSYSEKKIADDSNIFFLLDGVVYPGRIRTIFTIDDGEPHLIVAYLRELTPLTCAIDEDENFTYPHILHTSSSQWNYVPIQLKDFLEKSVFFRSSNGITYFIRFPTLEHCS